MCLILLLWGCLVQTPQVVYLQPAAEKPVVKVAKKAVKPQLRVALAVRTVPRSRAGMIRLTRVSAYNAHASQTDSTPNIAACGRVRANMLAVSRDLFQRGRRCGQWVTVHLRSGRQIRAVIWDTMNVRYRNTADILMYSISDARRFGVQVGWLEWR